MYLFMIIFFLWGGGGGGRWVSNKELRDGKDCKELKIFRELFLS